MLGKLSRLFCLLLAAISLTVMTRTEGIPLWQIIVYGMLLPLPCVLILFAEPFDRFFGFAPPNPTDPDSWSVTPWVGWLMLAVMVLVNHFARPPVL